MDRLWKGVWWFALCSLMLMTAAADSRPIAQKNSKIAILDFFNLTGDSKYDEWESLIGRGLRRNVFSRKDVVVIPFPRIHAAIQELQIDTYFIQPAQIPPLAKRIEADLVILGSFNVAEGFIAASIRIVNGATGAVLKEDTRFGTADKIQEFIADLGKALDGYLFTDEAPTPAAVPATQAPAPPPAPVQPTATLTLAAPPPTPVPPPVVPTATVPPPPTVAPTATMTLPPPPTPVPPPVVKKEVVPPTPSKDVKTDIVGPAIDVTSPLPEPTAVSKPPAPAPAPAVTGKEPTPVSAPITVVRPLRKTETTPGGTGPVQPPSTGVRGEEEDPFAIKFQPAPGAPQPGVSAPPAAPPAASGFQGLPDPFAPMIPGQPDKAPQAPPRASFPSTSSGPQMSVNPIEAEIPSLPRPQGMQPAPAGASPFAPMPALPAPPPQPAQPVMNEPMQPGMMQQPTVPVEPERPGIFRRTWNFITRPFRREPPPPEPVPQQQPPPRRRFFGLFGGDNSQSRAEPPAAPLQTVEASINEPAGNEILLASTDAWQEEQVTNDASPAMGREFPAEEESAPAETYPTEAMDYALDASVWGPILPEIRLSEDPVDSLVERGKVYFEQGNYTLAEDFFRKSVAAHRSDPDLIYNHAQALLALNRLDEGLAALEKVVELNPDDLDAHQRMGSLYANRKEWGKAVDAYTDAARLDPGNAKTFVRLGLALDMTGQPEQALRSYRKALSLDPGCAEAARNMASVYLKLGEKDEAARYVEIARDLNPELPELSRFEMLANLPKPSKSPLRGTLFTKTE